MGCSDEPGPDAFGEYVATDRHEPNILRLVDGPPGDELTGRVEPDSRGPRYLMAASGEDEVVVGAVDDQQLGAFFVDTVGDETWRAVDPPEIDGELEPQLVTVGNEAVLIGAVCPGDLDADAQDCADGYDRLGLWTFDPADRTWDEVLVSPDDLGIEPIDVGDGPADQWWWRVLGVVDGAVAVEIQDEERHLVTVDPSGRVQEHQRWEEGGPALCVTGSGTLVGTGGLIAGVSSTGDRVDQVDTTPVQVFGPDDDAWHPLGEVTVGGLQGIACGDAFISIVGETDASQETGQWRVVDLEGETAATSHPCPGTSCSARRRPRPSPPSSPATTSWSPGPAGSTSPSCGTSATGGTSTPTDGPTTWTSPHRSCSPAASTSSCDPAPRPWSGPSATTERSWPSRSWRCPTAGSSPWSTRSPNATPATTPSTSWWPNGRLETAGPRSGEPADPLDDICHTGVRFGSSAERSAGATPGGIGPGSCCESGGTPGLVAFGVASPDASRRPARRRLPPEPDARRNRYVK